MIQVEWNKWGREEEGAFKGLGRTKGLEKVRDKWRRGGFAESISGSGMKRGGGWEFHCSRKIDKKEEEYDSAATVSSLLFSYIVTSVSISGVVLKTDFQNSPKPGIQFFSGL